MARVRDGSLLQLHLPDGWPGGLAEPNVEFRYSRFEGHAHVAGVAPLAEVPSADTIVAVAPASAVLFVRASLPVARGPKMARLLALAVEDAIATAPEEVHAILVEHVPGGESLIAVVNREWLAAALDALAARGFRPDRFLVETELAMQRAAGETTRPWLVVRSPSGGFATLGEGDVVALDLGESVSAVPLALRLARDERARRGDAPGEVLVFTSPGTPPPDALAWGRELGLPVRNGGEWRPELIDARTRVATDLLRGDFAPTWRAADLARTLKFAGLTAAAVLGVHVLLTISDWWGLSSETRQLKTQMETQFRQLFPETQAVVDAPLQMRRNLGNLRREAGAPDASDLVPLLAAVAPALAGAGAQVERLQYQRGELEVDVTLPAGEERGAPETRFALPGYRVRVERVASGPSGNIATLRISAET